jgi:hypothetical protein
MSKKKLKSDTDKEPKVKFKKTGRAKKNKQRRTRYDDKKAVKDMIDSCNPDEYDDYSDYVGWNDD